MSKVQHRARRAVASVIRTQLGYKLLRRSGRELLTVIGDSHAQGVEHVRVRGLLPRTRICVTWVGGATTFGMANPNSRTNALETFRGALQGLPKGSPVLLVLGEVDAGFLVWLRAERNGTTPEIEAKDGLGRYRAFVAQEIIGRGLRPLILSVSPPTIEDYKTWIGLEGQRRAIGATWEQRAALTSWYNQQLNVWCAQEDYSFIDFTSDVTTPPHGRLRPQYVNPDPADHHLEATSFANLLAVHLRKAGFR